MTPPERTCAGCGRKAPERELIRFAAEDGRLVAGETVPGRGAYTCRRLSCFERAVDRRAFNRALKQNLVVDPALTRIFGMSLELNADGRPAQQA